MRVQKRNGTFENISFDKILIRLQNLSKDLRINVDIIAQKVINHIKDNIQTKELDELAARISTTLITTHPDYGILGSRIIISNHQKNTLSLFSEKMEQLYLHYDFNGTHCPIISKELYEFSMKYKTIIDSTIDYNRDFDMDYFSFKTLERSYLLRIHGKQIVERPQDMFMRVSLALHIHDLSKGLKSYELMSQKYFTHASPTLFNAGTNRQQLSSCFLLGTDDSIEGIYKTITDCGKISKWAGGIGVHLSNIRSKGALIRGTNGKTSGIIPMLRVYNDTALYVNQSGKRNGSFAMYLEPHHPDVFDFLEIRKNHGDELQRTRDLFTAMWLNNLFFERVKANQLWSLFDPDECPGLNECYGDAYKQLYEKYELENKYRKQVPARDIWKAMIISQIETGTPYVLNKDTVNEKSNQKNIGIIKSSNLCAEINLYSDDQEYAVCVLSSLCLPKYIENGVFNHEKLFQVVQVVVDNLNQVIDKNYYPVPETQKSNMLHRPLGIGVQGLSDVYSILRLPYDSPEASQINKEIFETIYYASLYASCMQSKEHGPYSTFDGSPLSRGIFQYNLWGIKDSDLSSRWNWQQLRTMIMKDGVRNSTLVALMPTASTSQIMGNNESFECYTTNIYTRTTLAGDFVLVNKYLIDDLIQHGLWNDDMKDKIIYYQGSIQNIAEIPQDIKNLYKTVWEISQKVVIDQSAERGPFICQSQSLNLYFQNPTYAKISSALLYAYSKGLKTLSYYTRSKTTVQAQQFSLDVEKVKQIENKQEECESCSG